MNQVSTEYYAWESIVPKCYSGASWTLGSWEIPLESLMCIIVPFRKGFTSHDSMVIILKHQGGEASLAAKIRLATTREVVNISYTIFSCY